MNAAQRPMFGKLLIANRGEIALRVMRSARALGIRTVAVYSEADADAEHVRQADEAIAIGGALPAQSYLRIDALIAAARATGAEAVHPGYGFLAENSDFAQACLDAGLVFVGPSPQAIRAMGDKAGAKQRMRAAGVPCIPGYDGEDQSLERLAEEAARIGWPVMIKASAGGGGRGMRLVQRTEDFAAALSSAQSEARNAFGDARVLLERALIGPRHIEVQVFADRHGHVIHLGERDCSVQRRHQKLIEEAPSPVVSPELRTRMGEAAVAAARAIGYEGAGTLEFLLDASGEFFFMEMNTRLQVEHPVTEAITGLDLVDWQLRVAAGQPLPLRQDEVRFSGHAIEVRLCAEAPAQDFMPASGTLHRWLPAPQLRVEHALRDGSVVPPFYDPMVAKLIAHGATRDEARLRLIAGLEDTVALGIATNQHFLQRCLAHPVFAAGDADTGFVQAHRAELLAADEDTGTPVAAAALATVLAGRSAPTALPAPWPLPLRLRIDGDHHAASLQWLRDGTVRIQPEGGAAQELRVHAQTETSAAHGTLQWVDAHGRRQRLPYARTGDETILMHWRGRAVTVHDRSRHSAMRHDSAQGDGSVRASTTGRVVAVHVQAGDAVEAGQVLITLEAMKMEHAQCAPHAGRIASLQAAVGQQVSAGQMLAEVAPNESPNNPSDSAKSPPPSTAVT